MACAHQFEWPKETYCLDKTACSTTTWVPRTLPEHPRSCFLSVENREETQLAPCHCPGGAPVCSSQDGVADLWLLWVVWLILGRGGGGRLQANTKSCRRLRCWRTPVSIPRSSSKNPKFVSIAFRACRHLEESGRCPVADELEHSATLGGRWRSVRRYGLSGRICVLNCPSSRSSFERTRCRISSIWHALPHSRKKIPKKTDLAPAY